MVWLLAECTLTDRQLAAAWLVFMLSLQIEGLGHYRRSHSDVV